jgi:dTDP-glucose pyrophosphorylase
VDVDIGEFLIPATVPIKEAMKQLDRVKTIKVLFIVDERKKLLGTLTDGDLRRWILAGGNFDSPVSAAGNAHPSFVGSDYEVDAVKHTMLKSNIECIPVVSSEGQVVDLLFWQDLFAGTGMRKRSTSIRVPVLVMAGGKGTRLDPLTKILPKALIPIGEKAIIEIIIERFCAHGVRDFFISVHHKSTLIRSFFEELNPDYRVAFVQEDFPLGTIGSLKLIEDRIASRVIVTNCDIIIDLDYGELVSFHVQNGYDLTLVASLMHYDIPYGTCEIEKNGRLIELREKPEYSLFVNTGMYVIQREVIRYIPQDTVFDVTDLIREIQRKGGTVGVFPISEKSWVDTGNWTEYRKTLERMG